MVRKTLFFLLFFSVLCSPLFSSEEIDGFAYFYQALKKEEQKFLSGNKNLFEKLTFVQNIHNILLDFQNTADKKTFYEKLRLVKPVIDLMTVQNESIFDEVYQNRFCDRRPFGDTFIYYNIFSKNQILNDDERKILYQEVLDRHKNIKLLPKSYLDKKAIKNLVSGQTYNFILNLQNQAYFSYDQRYKLKNKNAETILISPKHTFLSQNEPVLSSGVFYYYKVDQKELFILSCSSGHFHPLPESLKHIKRYLMNLGVPEEAIISLPISYEKIDSIIQKIGE